MHLVFVRHGQPEMETNEDAPADPGLSELGRWQSQQLAEWLTHEPVDHIISSTKRRAVETILPLSERLGLEPTLEEDFTEIDRNSRVYMPTEMLPVHGGEYYEAIRAGKYEEIGWDTPEEFHKRVIAAFERTCADAPGSHVVVSCHGGVINRIASELLGVTERIHMHVAYTGIFRVWIGEERRTVMSLNETAHCDARREGLTGTMRRGHEAAPQF